MTNPAVSILLPVRDAASTLAASIRSIQRQTLDNWECVAVDDGSSDATPKILAAAAVADPRFRVITTEPRGIVHALETGRAASNTPLLARMDADDWMHRARLERQLATLSDQPKLAAVGCHVKAFPTPSVGPGDRSYQEWLRSIRTPEDIARERYIECPVPHPTWMLRRATLDQIGGYIESGDPEDYDVLLRSLAAGHRWAVVPRRLHGWRHGNARLSRRSPRYAPDRFTELKATHLASEFLQGAASCILWGYGKTGRTLLRALAAHGKHATHIVELHPGRLGQRIQGAKVIHPDNLAAQRAALPESSRRVIASVAGAAARTRIRRGLVALGMTEGRDFVCAA